MADEPLKLIDARQKMFKVVLHLAADEMGAALEYVTYTDMTDAARELIAAADAWEAMMKRPTGGPLTQ